MAAGLDSRLLIASVGAVTIYIYKCSIKDRISLDYSSPSTSALQFILEYSRHNQTDDDDDEETTTKKDSERAAGKIGSDGARTGVFSKTSSRAQSKQSKEPTNNCNHDDDGGDWTEEDSPRSSYA